MSSFSYWRLAPAFSNLHIRAIPINWKLYGRSYFKHEAVGINRCKVASDVASHLDKQEL